MKEETQICDLVILQPGAEFSQQFVSSLLRTVCELIKNNKSFYIKDAHSSMLPDLRNRLIGSGPGVQTISGIPFAFDELKPKKIFFLDSDMAWNPDDFLKFVDSDEDIITGWYMRPDGSTVVMNKSDKLEHAYEMIPADKLKAETKLIEVDSNGMGFVCVKYEVLEKIGYPWFQFFQAPALNEEAKIFPPQCGEDLWFFKRAQEEGYKVMVDPTVQPSHIKSIPLRWE